MDAYSDGQLFAGFMSYLRARGAMRGHQLKHISLARKVLDYLKSGSDSASPIRSHAERLDMQLSRLEGQVSASAPRVVKDALPEAEAVHSWVDMEVDLAFRLVRRDMNEFGRLSAY